MYQKINLFFAAILVIMLLYIIPDYNSWFDDKIINGADYGYQLTHRTPEERFTNRFGTSYSVYMAVASTLKTYNSFNSVILLPTAGYVKAMKPVGDFIVPEPPIFYYFTGVKAVTPRSANVAQATWALVIEDHKPGIRRILDKQALNELITLFNKYK
jgi:hypothetical protein